MQRNRATGRSQGARGRDTLFLACADCDCVSGGQKSHGAELRDRDTEKTKYEPPQTGNVFFAGFVFMVVSRFRSVLVFVPLCSDGLFLSGAISVPY